MIVAFSKTFDALSDIFYGLLQQHEQMGRVAISRMIQGGLQLVTLGVLIAVTHNLVWGVIGMAIASGLVTASYDVRSAILISRSSPHNTSAAIDEKQLNNMYPRWNKAVLVNLAVLALPLGLAISLGSLLVNIPRYFIEYNLGQKELGMFAAVSYLMTAGSIVVSALGQSASPRLAKYYASGKWSAFDALVLRLVCFGALLGGIGVLLVLVAGRYILTLLYSPEYAKHQDVLLCLMGAYSLQYAYVFCGTAINAMRDFKTQFPIQIASCLIVVTLCFYLVSPFGLIGGAWAMFTANVFEAGAYTVVLLKLRKAARQNTTMKAVHDT